MAFRVSIVGTYRAWHDCCVTNEPNVTNNMIVIHYDIIITNMTCIGLGDFLNLARAVGICRENIGEVAGGVEVVFRGLGVGTWEGVCRGLGACMGALRGVGGFTWVR
uniref:Uncharacterized protein n=1 Tax=Ciona intestinalis TaxID=7719 RepID=H2Y370_CIOIN